MPPRSSRFWTAVAVLAGAAFFAGLVRFASHALVRGGAYPEYSSFRADPLGTKALHDTLARLPGYTVTRNLRPLRLLKVSDHTLFWLGEQTFSALLWKKEQFDLFDRVLARNNRVVIGFEAIPSSEVEPKMKTGPIGERWGIRPRVELRKSTSNKGPSSRGALRETSAWLELVDHAAWTCFSENEAGHCVAAERRLGAGTLVLVCDVFPLSNEGLRVERDTAYIATLTGANQRIVFDEDHLGLEDASSIGLLLRQFRQQGAIAALLALFGLFLWRNTASFLPVRPVPRQAPAADDAHHSLVLLLRRGVKPAALREALLHEWQRSRALLPFKHRARAAAVEASLAAPSLSASGAWRQALAKLQGHP